MEYKNLEKMNVKDVVDILSQTMQDVRDRKVTLRYAMVVSRLALAMTKTIEIVELKDRLEFLEQVLKKRK